MLSVDPTRCVSARQNVLLLGISYPCVPSQMAKHGFDEDVLTCKEPSVDQAVECVLRGILTEMDARDLARCVATEKATNTHVYTVSREIGAEYKSDRHVHCDFNARNFCQTLQKQFGRDIQFSQVILDYYWMPTGWLVTRWAKTLFQQTLPDLVRYRMLTFPSKRKSHRRGNGPPYDIDEGVVYLPFCAHVCKELVGAIHILKDYYEITFLNKKDLHGHSLWKGTMEIDANVMQTRLGKRLDQEEIYCTFRPKDIFESMEDPHVRKPEVMRILLAIKNYDDIRMVRLRPLRQHEPANVFRQRLYEHEKETGGFKGLDFVLANRLLKEMKKGRRKKDLPAMEEEKKEDEIILTKKKSDNPMTTKTTKVLKPRRKKTAHSGTKTTVCADVESPDPDELIRFQFFPGPVRDLTTYIEAEEMAAEDERQIRKTQKKSPGKKKWEANPVSFSLQKRSMLGADSSKLRNVVDQAKYLAFNPRIPRPTNQDASADSEFWELDWTIVPEDDGDPVECPTLANALDIKAASNLYHCILKGLQTRNMAVNGTERVARVDLDGRTETGTSQRGVTLSDVLFWCKSLIHYLIYRFVTACFAIDQKQSDYQQITGYKLRPAADLSAAMKEAEIPLRAIIEAFHGSWEQLLDVDDRIWLAKISTSRQRTVSYEIKVADGSVREVLVDRVQNLNNIIRWLLFDQNEKDDPSGSFGLIWARLIQFRPKLMDEGIGKQAWEIENRLNTEIKGISVNVRSFKGAASTVEDSYMRHVLEKFLGLVLPPVIDRGDAASTMISLRKEINKQRTKLLRDVTKWLDSGMDSDDPTGEFRQVSKLPSVSSLASDGGLKLKEERASAICARVASLRNVVAYFEHEQTGEFTPHVCSQLEPARRRRKPMNQFEHEFLDSLAMLHQSVTSVSAKSASNPKDTTKSRHDKRMRSKSRTRDSPSSLIGTTKVSAPATADCLPTTSKKHGRESTGTTLPNQLVQIVGQLGSDKRLSSVYLSELPTLTGQEKEAVPPHSTNHCSDTGASEACRPGTIQPDCMSTHDVIIESEKRIAVAIPDDSSTSDTSSVASTTHCKRKHLRSDSLVTITIESIVPERTTTPEQDVIRKTATERKKKNLGCVSVLEEAAPKKRKADQKSPTSGTPTKRMNTKWRKKENQHSPRLLMPSERDKTSSDVPAMSEFSSITPKEQADENPHTTSKTSLYKPKRVNHQMIDILGRLRNRDDALDCFVHSSGTTREEYDAWMECFSKSHGSQRAELLTRICRWFGSNRQLAETAWERTTFDILNQHLAGREISERAVMMEHLIFLLKDTLDESKGAMSDASLKENLNCRIKNLIASHNPPASPIHLPLLSNGRPITPRETATPLCDARQPMLHLAHESMDHFSSPPLVVVNPDNISDIHNTVRFFHSR